MDELQYFVGMASFYQGFWREKDGNRGKFIGSNLVIFCYKEFEKFALWKSVSQSEAKFIVYFEPIESGHVRQTNSNHFRPKSGHRGISWSKLEKEWNLRGWSTKKAT